MLNKGTTWYHFLQRLWYDAVLDLGLNPGPLALDTSTLPLGYRGGGEMYHLKQDNFFCHQTILGSYNEQLQFLHTHKHQQ